MPLAAEHLTGPIIGAAISVHRTLGPGFIESIYERALVLELSERGIRFQQQHVIPVLYREVEVGMHKLDLLVDQQIVVELKTVKDVGIAHFAVMRSYFRAASCTYGLILNFAKRTLEVKRVRSL